LKLEIHAIDWFNILLYSEIITITVVKQEKKGKLRFMGVKHEISIGGCGNRKRRRFMLTLSTLVVERFICLFF